MKLQEIKGKKTLFSLAVLLICIFLILTMFVSSQPMDKAANADGYDFEFYFLINGQSQIDLENLSTHLQYGTYLLVEMYVSSLSAPVYEVATIAGTMYFDKTYFNLPAVTSIDVSESTTDVALTVPPFGTQKVQNWSDKTFNKLDSYTDRVHIGFSSNPTLVNVPIGQDLLMAKIWLEVVQLPTEPTQIYWDFNDEYNPGQATFTRNPGSVPYYNYLETDYAGRIQNDDNVLKTPLYLGEPVGGDPSADLSSVSLKDTQTATQYLNPAFAPETTTYGTWQIPYAQNQNGMILEYSKESSSAAVDISFSAGSSAVINDNLITGLANGDEIFISVSDNEGAMQKTYTITAWIAAPSSNNNLSSLTARSGATNLNFAEPFHKDTLSYTLNLPYKFTQVTLTAALEDTLSTMKIDGQSVTSRTFTGIPVGTTVKNIIVTAQDLSEKTYTVSIVRAPASQNTELASIKVNNNDVEINEYIKNFSYILAESSGSYVFSILGAEPLIQKIEYEFEGSGTGYVVMPNGGNSGSPRTIAKNQSVIINIRVTAEDVSVVENYTLTISRAPSTNTNLSSVTVQEGGTVKTLIPEGTLYTYTLAATGENQITITALGIVGENATIRIIENSTGNELVGGVFSTAGLMAGTYSFTIEVTPQDVNAPVKNYSLNVIKKSDAKALLMPVVTHTNNYDAVIEGMTYNESTFTYNLIMSYALSGVIVNDIRIVLTASANSTITSPGWANLKPGAPVSGQPTAFADISFFNSTTTQYLDRDIIITAEDGSVQSYMIKLTRSAANTNNTLTSLLVGGNTVDGFSPNTLIYDTPIIFPGDTQTINVYGEPNSEFSTVTYNGNSTGQISLTRGVLTTININVTAQSGAVRTYTIKVIAANTDNTITNITLLRNDLTVISGLSFEPGNLGPYNISVPFTTSIATIEVATPSGALSTVYGQGTFNLLVKTNTYIVYAVSEAGVKGLEYTINITRNAARTEKILESLTISSAGTNPVPNYITNFISSTTEYNIRVNRDVTSLRVQATLPPDNGSSITSGLTDNFTWTGTSATIYVDVTAEDSSVQRYRVNVTRANDINEIEDIEVSVQEINYSAAVTNYALNPIPFTTSTITFSIALKDSYSKLYVKVNTSATYQQNNPDSFDVALNTGANTINIYAVSDFGTQGTTYRFTITRNTPSTNAKLATLEVIAGGNNLLVGDKEFNPNIYIYNLRVNNDITSIIINATTDDNKAKLAISPTTRTLSSGLNTFYITVTAEDNVTQLGYELRITRANDVNDIDNIQTDIETIAFDAELLNYSLNSVGFSVSTMTFNVTLRDNSAKLYVKVNNGSYNLQSNPGSFDVSLVTGTNTINIYALSEFGTQGSTYKFTVVRNTASANARLGTLEIIASGNNLLAGENAFNPDTQLYNLRVNNNITTITINATPEDNKASVEITPTGRTLSSGLNTYFITVTAEDNTSKLTYEVKITRANDVNDIDNIQVDLQSISFEAATTSYNLNAVNFSINTITFNVTLRDSSAKLYVKVNAGATNQQNNPNSFDLTLATGTNNIYIYAVSEFGTQGATYVFTIIRNAASANAKLSSLEILASGQNLLVGDKAFHPDVALYNLRVNNDIESIIINTTTEDNKAKVAISPTGRTLSSGLNTFYITVTAEDNTTQLTYEVRITKANDINDIDDIAVNVQEINFDAEVTTYALNPVAYAVKTITFNVTLVDPSAKLYIKVNNGSTRLENSPESFYITLTMGDNTINIYAVSEFGTQGETYVFTVTQNPVSTNARLSNLEVIAGGSNILTGDNSFDSDTTLYTLRVDNNISSVAINATPEDSKASVAVTPANLNLSSGLNTYYATVTAEDGVTKKVYEIRITKANDINDIDDIEVSVQAISFDSLTTTYALDAVAFNINIITFTVTLRDSSAKLYVKVNTGAFNLQNNPGSFDINLSSGNNTISIYALSEFGTQGATYVFTITRNLASTNAKLSSLEIIGGGNDLLVGDNAFSPDTYLYQLRVDNNITSIEINAQKQDSKAKVVITPPGRTLNSGLNNFYITVTAEDNVTELVYEIKITRANDNNNIDDIDVNLQQIEFNPSTTSYPLDAVAFSVKTITFDVSLADPTAKLYVKHNAASPRLENNPNSFYVTLVAGQNTINIYAVSEFGTQGYVYVFTITQNAASNDATLSSLQAVAGGNNLLVGDKAFDAEVTLYDVRVNSNISTVNISATASNAYASVSISPAGTNLINGKNTFYITVTAESGATNTYTLIIYRANDNNTILEIRVNGTPIPMNPSAPMVIPDVPHSVKNIIIAATLQDSSATIYGTGTKTLVDGTQVFEVYAISQYGLLTGVTKDHVPVYTLQITRTPISTDNKLEGLNVTDNIGNILPFDSGIAFDPLRYSYTITLDTTSTLTEVIINAVAQSNFKTVSGDLGVQALITNQNGTISSQFVITVTAESGATQNYFVNVVKGTTLSNDTSIKTITLKDSDNNEYLAFNPNVAKQTDVNLPYVIPGLTLTIVPNDANATVSGTYGYITVAAGGNTYVQFKIIAQDGTESQYLYNFNIFRAAPRTEKHLETLTIKDVNDNTVDFLNGIFNSSTSTYSIRVDDIVASVVIDATVPANNGSKIISAIENPYALTSGGVVSIYIIVQAEDNSTRIYTLNIKRANNDNRIEAIRIGQTVVPIEQFTLIAGAYEYTVSPNVLYSVSTLEIEAILTGGVESKATVTGAGVKNLSVGNNNFIVFATAQDGTKGSDYLIRVTREAASSDASLKSIKIIANTEEILLDVPSNVQNQYNIQTNRSVSEVSIEAVQNNAAAKLMGDTGSVTLNGGVVNTLRIFVTAEDGTVRTYTLNIEVKDNNNSIVDIASNRGELTFQSIVTSYNLGSVSYATNEITFTFTLGSSFATLYVNSAIVSNLSSAKYSLNEGVNTFVVYAVSERGTKGQEYTLNITRLQADSNNYLSSLSLTDGNNVLPFEEGEFNRNIMDYTVRLNPNSNFTFVEILATAENGSLPAGIGIKQLKEVNLFVVTVTAENGDRREYSISVTKSQSNSSDNEVKDISLIGKGQEYLKNIFNPDVARQSDISVPFTVDSVYLSIIAHEKARIIGAGLYNIPEGETITIQFRIIAENDDAGLLYEVDVTREYASTDNTLDELYYEVDGIRYYLDTDTETHTINVSIETESIILGGLAPDGATVNGFREYTLTNTVTTRIITVTAENGEFKNYVINIVKQSDDSTIKSILLDGKEIINDFINNIYQVNVPFTKSNATIIATPNNSNATIHGNGNFTLSTGMNQFVVYAVSEAGNQGDGYTIRITRQMPNSNNNLSSLIVKDTATEAALILQPVFISSTTKYTIDITDFPEIQEISIEALPESPLVQKIEGTGIFILKTAFGESSEIFTVTVTAEDGSTKKYDITVIRNVKPEDDISVHQLSFIGSDSINYLGTAANAITKFEMSKKYYNITIPFKVRNGTLTIVNNNGAAIYGNGNYVFSDDKETIIEFYLDSQSGKYTSETYVIVVNRELPSDDNTLSSLTIDGTLIEGFDPQITSYDITVTFEEVSSIQVAAVANHKDASVIGDLGVINLSAGMNNINITVRAEDNSTKTYTVIIRRLSIDNTLLHLGVTHYTISPLYNKEVTNYTLTVPYTTEMVNIEAITNSKATISGNGHLSLQIGENVAEVFVTSEQGVTGEVYRLVITREAPSSDNTLKSLTVLSGVDGQPLQLQPSFRPEITDYIIQLEEQSTINTLEILAIANCPHAKGVGGTGYKVLKTTVDGKYNNVFEIIVMAQNNATRLYTVSVYRDVNLADDITMGVISLMGSDGVNYLGNNGALTSFLPNVFSYNIVVPYYVESITLSIETLTATVYGCGQKMFGNENRVTFLAYLVSQSGLVTSNNYTIVVNRTLPLEDNSLKNIRLNGQLIEGFSPELAQYEINIPYLTTDKIIISAEPNSPSAVILNGTGSFDIKEGRNVFSILVRAENGDTKSYNLVINYMNTNSFLESLSLHGAMDDYINDQNSLPYPFTFIPDSFNYIVTVDKNIKTINLKGEAQDQERAAIIGLGKYTLTQDRTTIVVNVIAADNVTTSTYTINVVKTVMPSANTRLKDLQVGGYSLSFTPETHSYMLNVGNGTNSLDVTAITEDPNAKATIIGNDFIDIGRNIILVQVEAEDGTVSYYQLSINKNQEPDYFLTVMLILIFLLLLIAFLYKFINNNKDKSDRKDLKGFKLNTNESIDLNNIGKEAKKWQT